MKYDICWREKIKYEGGFRYTTTLFGYCFLGRRSETKEERRSEAKEKKAP